MKNLLKYILQLLALIFISCNAPRNNPLDPENPDNKIISIEGTVLTDTRDPSPIDSVNIIWMNENITCKSDENGNFKIKCFNHYNGWLYFEKSGYTTDSVYVNWIGNNKFSVNVHLNSLPVLNSVSLYSVVRNKYSTTDYLLNAECKIVDVDDDIDSVLLVNQSYKISKRLSKLNAYEFEGSFYDYELGLSSLENLVGKDFEIVASTKGKETVVGKASIKRIINDVIEFISPANQELVSTTPTLKWKKFTEGFNFTYTVEIYTDDPLPELVWREESIPSSETSIIVDIELPISQYNDQFFWVIWCVDDYKNMARSRTAGFVVQ